MYSQDYYRYQENKMFDFSLYDCAADEQQLRETSFDSAPFANQDDSFVPAPIMSSPTSAASIDSAEFFYSPFSLDDSLLANYSRHHFVSSVLPEYISTCASIASAQWYDSTLLNFLLDAYRSIIDTQDARENGSVSAVGADSTVPAVKSAAIEGNCLSGAEDRAPNHNNSSILVVQDTIEGGAPSRESQSLEEPGQYQLEAHGFYSEFRQATGTWFDLDTADRLNIFKQHYRMKLELRYAKGNRTIDMQQIKKTLVVRLEQSKIGEGKSERIWTRLDSFPNRLNKNTTLPAIEYSLMTDEQSQDSVTIRICIHASSHQQGGARFRLVFSCQPEASVSENNLPVDVYASGAFTTGKKPPQGRSYNKKRKSRNYDADTSEGMLSIGQQSSEEPLAKIARLPHQ